MRIKTIIVGAVLLLTSIAGFSQEKYFTKQGKVTFYSKAPLEDIQAHNRNAVSVFDKSTGLVEISILLKAFEFEKALMQEHFNENYVESDKFPKSVFRGKITDLSAVDFTKNGKYNITVAGQLNLHGQTKEITAPATFIINDGAITVVSEFNLLLDDYKISIPALVKDKVSKQIKISVENNYEPLNH